MRQRKGERLGAPVGEESHSPFLFSFQLPSYGWVGKSGSLCPTDPAVSNSAKEEEESTLGLSLSHVCQSAYQRAP